MKVFLTGATGYIGSAVAEVLQAAGHSVAGLARSIESDEMLRARGITPYRADFTNPESLAEPVQTCDAVVSTATTNNGRLDTDGIARMLNELNGTGKPFIYTSGVWVLGDTRGEVADEAAPLNPAALVAWRADAEKLVLSAAAAGVRAIVIRPAVVYGRGAGIPAGFIQSAQESGAARYVGNGENHWPTVHVEDLATLYLHALEKAPARSIYNAAENDAYRVREIAEAASFGADAGGRTESWPLEEARKTLGPYADALVLDQQISSHKAKRELGWTPQAVSILEELRYGSYALPRVSP